MAKAIMAQAFPERPTQMTAQHISRLAQVLNDLGFESRVEMHGAILTIISENCPILSVAKLYHQLICQTFHNELLKQGLGNKAPVLNDCMALGDPFCKHVIRMEGQS